MENELVLASELKEELTRLPVSKRFSFGHALMDKYLHEIALGDFFAIGGLPGSGKTSFAISLTKNLAKQGVSSIWFSIEMPPREFLDKFGEALPEFYIPRENKPPTMKWLEERVDEGIARFGAKLVFIDHLGMIVNESIARERNSVEIYDERLKTIKSWAVNKGIVVFGISAGNQTTAANTKGKKEPSIADYRGTAMISYVADTLLFIKRMTGVKNEVILNDILEDEFAISTEADLSILKCRRSGVMRAKIRMAMDSNGDFKEL